MCGIYGSTYASKFEVLDIANQTRGNFASGLYYHDGKNFDFQRTEGSFNWNDIKLPNGFIYLGHNQAPTSSIRAWSERNSHPFAYKNWVVAHNGVITNFNDLKSKHLPDHENGVDSSIIPALLLHFEEQSTTSNSIKKETELIKHVLELLEGTFGLWIVNTSTLNVYIARQGSTLFFDKNSFSSTKGQGYDIMEEGTIYKFTKKGFKAAGLFEPKSPFLVI